ncbi:hypothetical protein CTRI78_v001504 [Colletotrichum trifolii]|uniref:Uncharacterized protein n=1 Tax=Colletotrichum trifolii TaxID=5466 RepID=A0A4R8RZ56_COLTR|nr:hypothetical protein CTRI78_v001504 [Colletotrichum trifolii]
MENKRSYASGEEDVLSRPAGSQSVENKVADGSGPQYNNDHGAGEAMSMEDFRRWANSTIQYHVVYHVIPTGFRREVLQHGFQPANNQPAGIPPVGNPPDENSPDRNQDGAGRSQWRSVFRRFSRRTDGNEGNQSHGHQDEVRRKTPRFGGILKRKRNNEGEPSS